MDDTWCNYSDLPSPLSYLNSSKQSNKINHMVSVEVKFEYGMFDNIQLELPMIPEINSNFTIDKKLLIAKNTSKCKIDSFYVRGIDYFVDEDYNTKVVVNLYSHTKSF